MIIDSTLFLTFLLCTVSAGWLFANRHGNYTRWVYLSHSFGFACFMLGTIPGMNDLTLVGIVINTIASGLGIIGKMIVEIHARHGMDIRAGKLITHPK